MRRAGRILGCVAATLAGLVSATGAADSETYNWSAVAMGGGGYVSGVFAHPSERNLFYARTDVGGAYRWDESSHSWAQLVNWPSSSQTSYLGVEALAMDPSDPDKLYLLLGTSYWNGGITAIARSSDRGASFALTEVTSSFKEDGNGMGRQSGEKLAVDPHKGTILFCGTRSAGLWKSVDAGASWSQVSSFPVTSTTNGVGVSFVVFDSAKGVDGKPSPRIWAGVERTGSTNLYVSEDSGASWNAVSGASTTYWPNRATQVGGSLYVTYVDASGPWNIGAGALYRCRIAAGTCTDISPVAGYPYGAVVASPLDTNRIFVSTVDKYLQQDWGWGDYLYLSTDGGSSWTSLFGKSYVTLDAGDFPWIEDHAIHWAGSAAMDPFDTARVFVGSGNGIFLTEDLSAGQAATWSFAVRGLEETVPLDLAPLPGGGVATAIGDYDGFVSNDVAVSPVRGNHSPEQGSNYGIAVAWSAGNVMARTTGNSAGYLYASTDSGASWTAVAPSGGSAKGYVALSSDGRTLLWNPAGSSTTYRLTRSGSTWTAQTSASGLSLSSYLPLADGTDPSRFYAYATSSGAFYASTDSGKTFAQAGTTTSGGSVLIRAAMGRTKDVWVALGSNGLRRTTDGGSSFSSLSSVSSCAAVGFGVAKAGHSYPAVYIWGTVDGTEGLYRSDDTGTSWIRINDDDHEFGGLGNGQFVSGDAKTYGRVYLSSAGLGVPYGEPASTTDLTGGSSVGTRTMFRTGDRVAAPGERPIVLTDLRGRRLRGSRVSQGLQELDLAGLPSGVYVARRGSESLVVARP